MTLAKIAALALTVSPVARIAAAGCKVRARRLAGVAGLALALVAIGVGGDTALAQGRGEQSRPAPAPSLKPPSEAAVKKLTLSLVKVQAHIPPEASSSQRLGTKREGSGVVIDDGTLVVTVGYLINEAQAITVTDSTGRNHRATPAFYDQASGLGLLRLAQGVKLPALELGDSAGLRERQPIIAAAAGGAENVLPALVVSRREYAGSWEYLLERAIYTSPPIAQFGGAALVDGNGRLLGIGSLILQAVLPDQPLPGNVFVPIDLLPPLLRDLAAGTKPKVTPRPWLGMNAEETQGGLLIVGRVTKDGPASKAGIRQGDVVIGIGERRVRGLADFYRRVWALGGPGVAVPLEVMQRDGFRKVTVKSGDRGRIENQQTY